MIWYPIFLDLRGRSVLVAGAGGVALRKAKALLEAGAEVTVVAPDGQPEFDRLPVVRLRRPFQRGDVRDQALVFAATNDRAVNQAVAAEASRRGIPVNVADSPNECSFLVPARIQEGDLQVAVSTSGKSPKLAVELKKTIQKLLRATIDKK